jgi:hypothetical protein
VGSRGPTLSTPSVDKARSMRLTWLQQSCMGLPLSRLAVGLGGLWRMHAVPTRSVRAWSPRWPSRWKRAGRPLLITSRAATPTALLRLLLHRSVLADLVGECFNCLAQTMWRRCGRTCHTASAVAVRGIRLGLLRLVAPLSALSTPGRGHQPLGSVV